VAIPTKAQAPLALQEEVIKQAVSACGRCITNEEKSFVPKDRRITEF
jgi:hypothetical protein